MKHGKRAFTLIEMVVIMAILAGLCAILFPVFASARGAADRAVCISNLHNLGDGTHLYLADYDDRLMPVNFDPATVANSRTDRTWVQTLLPYMKTFAVFRCPADHTNRPRPESTFDQDLVPGDTDSQYYSASLRSNYGYNFQNLAPIVQDGDGWSAEPKSVSQISEVGSTLLFVESVWTHTDSGEPTGGGNWLVVPPCRYYADDNVDSFTGRADGNAAVFTTALGWHVGTHHSVEGLNEPTGPVSNPELYGNAWPWHNGHFNIAFIDGSVRNLTPGALENGCDVQEAWLGKITSRKKYLWDVN